MICESGALPFRRGFELGKAPEPFRPDPLRCQGHGRDGVILRVPDFEAFVAIVAVDDDNRTPPIRQEARQPASAAGHAMRADRAIEVPHMMSLPADAVDAAFALWIEVRALQIFRSLHIAPLALAALRMIVDGELARRSGRYIEGIKIAACVINDGLAVACRIADVKILVAGSSLSPSPFAVQE